jgi:hypothetical protein
MIRDHKDEDLYVFHTVTVIKKKSCEWDNRYWFYYFAHQCAKIQKEKNV